MDLSLRMRMGGGGMSSPPPSITSINYSQGDTAGGGQSIVIAGTDLSTATAVTFLGTAATSFSVDSDTQITATLPAHAAGSGNVEVTGPGGSDTIAFEYWAPSARTPTGLWLASYGGSPWSGSYGGNLSEATNPPSVGASLGGYTPADFDGSNDKLKAASKLNTYIGDGTGAWYVGVLLRCDSLGFPIGLQQNKQIICDHLAAWGMCVADDGLRAYCAEIGTTSGAIPFSTGAWGWAEMWYAGTATKVLSLALNGGTATTKTASDLVNPSARNLIVGMYSQYFDGQIAAIVIESANPDAPTRAKYKAFVQQRYGVSV